MMRFRECREKAGMSQKYVALTLGVAAPSVSNWESGKTKPSRDNTLRMADLYGVSVDYLLGRTDSPTKDKLKEIGEALNSPSVNKKLKRLTAGLLNMPETDLDFVDKLLSKTYPNYFVEGNEEDDA